jgi:hypothetical protein
VIKHHYILVKEGVVVVVIVHTIQKPKQHKKKHNVEKKSQSSYANDIRYTVNLEKKITIQQHKQHPYITVFFILFVWLDCDCILHYSFSDVVCLAGL